MKTQRWLWGCILLISAVVLAACSGGSGTSDEGLESYSESPQEDFQGPGFEGQTFTFSMTANLGQLLADAARDSMETEWTGTFTVDDDGLIHGAGNAVLNAAIFSETDGCGYVWYENAEFVFELSGEAEQRSEGTQLSLVVDLASDPDPFRTDAAATCADPGGPDPEQTPEIYFDLHRDTMLNTIQLGLARLGPRILIGQPLEAETNGVTYTILVDLPAVPLTD